MANVDVPPLLATSWTSAGDAHPQSADERSPLPLTRRARALENSGWSGMGLVHADLVPFLESGTLDSARQILDDHGLVYREVEFLTDWWTSGTARAASDRMREELFEAAHGIGATNIKIAPPTGSDPVSRTLLTDSLHSLAEHAADAGLRIALESLPFSLEVPTVESAIELLEAVNHASAGLCLDIWHASRGGSNYFELARRISPSMLFVVELDDAASNIVGTLWEDTVHNRLLPGDGALDVPFFIQAVQQIGFEGPWGVEMIAKDYRKMPVEEAVASAMSSTLRCFEKSK